MMRRWRATVLALLGAGALTLGGCKSVGWQFPHDTIDMMMMGDTTLEEVRQLVGEPFRVGDKDGRIVWTYVDYHVSLFGEVRLRDLRLEFDAQQRLVSYEYNTNIPNEREIHREKMTR